MLQGSVVPPPRHLPVNQGEASGHELLVFRGNSWSEDQLDRTERTRISSLLQVRSLYHSLLFLYSLSLSPALRRDALTHLLVPIKRHFCQHFFILFYTFGQFCLFVSEHIVGKFPLRINVWGKCWCNLCHPLGDISCMCFLGIIWIISFCFIHRSFFWISVSFWWHLIWCFRFRVFVPLGNKAGQRRRYLDIHIYSLLLVYI